MSSWTTNLVIWACEKQNENILKECIEMKYNLNEPSLWEGWSPLMVAVLLQNNLNQIKLLVTNGADFNHVNYIGNCVLDCTRNNEYLLFLKNKRAIKLNNHTDGMSKLAIEIANNKPCSITTKEEVNKVDARGFTPFLWAIYYKRQNYIDYYLKLGADVNQAGRTGITPLMMAFYQGNIDIVKKLVENGAKVNQLDHNGLSAIAYIIFPPSTEIVDYLLENGAQIDPCISEKGRSPLMRAAITNNTDTFNYFLNKNANINFIDCDGNSVLSYTILNENIEHAEKLIEKGANLDACGLKGKTPLAWSVFLNNPEITKFLLDNGANVNCTDHQGRTALYYAEKYQYTDIIKLLKDNGASTTITQNQDIFSAIRAKDIDSVKTMLDGLATIYKKNEKNQTVIDVAIQVADFKIINLLLENKNNSFVHSALPIAIRNQNIPVIKLLLEKGANVNRIYKKTKQSPLIQAINQENAEIVELLLKFNANIKTNEDPSPFQRALQLGNGKILKMVLEKVVDVNEPENGKSLLQIAIDENNIDVIMLLLEKGADSNNSLSRLKELAEEFDDLDIFLENLSVNFNEENSERQTNKTETN